MEPVRQVKITEVSLGFESWLTGVRIDEQGGEKRVEEESQGREPGKAQGKSSQAYKEEGRTAQQETLTDFN